jgi:ribosomal protein S28E/S33
MTAYSERRGRERKAIERNIKGPVEVRNLNKNE